MSIFSLLAIIELILVSGLIIWKAIIEILRIFTNLLVSRLIKAILSSLFLIQIAKIFIIISRIALRIFTALINFNYILFLYFLLYLSIINLNRMLSFSASAVIFYFIRLFLFLLVIFLLYVLGILRFVFSVIVLLWCLW